MLITLQNFQCIVHFQLPDSVYFADTVYQLPTSFLFLKKAKTTSKEANMFIVLAHTGYSKRGRQVAHF